MSFGSRPSLTAPAPPSRSITSLTEKQIFSALRGLRFFHCSLNSRFATPSHSSRKTFRIAPTPFLDSGYASGYTSDDEADKPVRHLLPDEDLYSPNQAVRWLTELISKADQLHLISDNTREQILDEASTILASFCQNQAEGLGEETGILRDFSFTIALPSESPSEIVVSQYDAISSDTDHTDVGLQLWGAAARFAELLCSDPTSFGLMRSNSAADPTLRIIELGAGTGLVSLVIAKLLSCLGSKNAEVIATDYHPSVLANLRKNVEANFNQNDPVTVNTCTLEWATPKLEAPLQNKASMLVGADVVYAPEHAVWLRDCALRLLDLEGTLWLLVTVRESGKFKELAKSVEDAFDRNNSPKRESRWSLRILRVEKLEKKSGIGRGDECWYKLYKIGWTEFQ